MTETTIINRRETDPDDTDRLRRRADLRAEAAKLQFQKDRIPALEAVLAESHSRVEVATDAHSAACEPLQRELRELEAEAWARIQRRQSPDAEADARRVEIVRELAAHNAELEQVVEAEKIVRAPVEREVWRLRNQVLDPNAVLHALKQPPLASPALMVEAHVASQAGRFANARVEAAKRALKIHEANVEGLRSGKIGGDLAAELFHARKWKAELQAAGAAVAAALAEGQRVSRAMLDE